jgi:hypothetical protein
MLLAALNVLWITYTARRAAVRTAAGSVTK